MLSKHWSIVTLDPSSELFRNGLSSSGFASLRSANRSTCCRVKSSRLRSFAWSDFLQSLIKTFMSPSYSSSSLSFWFGPWYCPFGWYGEDGLWLELIRFLKAVKVSGSNCDGDGRQRFSCRYEFIWDVNVLESPFTYCSRWFDTKVRSRFRLTGRAANGILYVSASNSFESGILERIGIREVIVLSNMTMAITKKRSKRAACQLNDRKME